MHTIEEAGRAVAAVGRSIVSASRSADAAAEETARCISTLIGQRREQRLPLDTGLDELDRLAVALQSQLVARSELIRTRLALVRLPKALGVEGYGPSCPCDQSEEKGRLVAVQAA